MRKKNSNLASTANTIPMTVAVGYHNNNNSGGS